MYYLDTNAPVLKYERVLRDKIYVDKTMLIEKTNDLLGRDSCYVCITRPRRFGKTINANMLGAYYTVGYDCRALFHGLKIESSDTFEKHLNKHHVIYIDFSRMPDYCNCFDDYLSWINDRLTHDMKTAFGIEKENHDSIQDIIYKTKEKYVFLLDEWDSVFYEDFMSEADKKKYLKFLKGLLKDQPYVELAYMTGVLPIAKYSAGSELNMFDECGFLNDPEYEDYYGFSETEVKELCRLYPKPGYEDLVYWYDGYYKSNGSRLFNPRSVSFALSKGFCKNYWTESGPMNEIAQVIEHNVDAVREDIVKLVAGIPVEIKLDGYAATQLDLNNRNEILSAMVVYGFLSYYDNQLRIPNKELMEKFEQILKRESMGAVSEIVTYSREVLQATINKEADKVAAFIEKAHDKEIPFIKYNDENSMSCVITLCYLYARNYYKIKREEQSGKGYADFIFKPLKDGYPAMVLELKYGKSAEEAIQQIKHKHYSDALKDYGEILLVGINYTEKDKLHTCIIETYHNEL